MIRRPMVLWSMAGLIGVAVCSGCQRVQQSAAIPVVGDSLRGVVQVVGSDPQSTVQLQLVTGQVVPLEGAELAALRMAAGLDVVVRGAVVRADQAFTVEQFRVRGVDGVPAVDGWLTSIAPGRYALRTADGVQLPLTDMPETLTQFVGSRVFWAGPLDRAPVAYGLLVVRR